MEFKYVRLRYTENGEEFSFTIPGGTVQTENVSLKVTQKGNCISVRVRAEDEIVMQELSAVYEHLFNESDRIFLNGYQSWTESTEHRVSEKMRGLRHIPAQLRSKYALTQYGDYNFADYDTEAGVLHGWTYGYIRDYTQFRLFGSLNEQTGFTCWQTDTVHGTVTAGKDCAGLHLTGDLRMELFTDEGAEQDVFDAYFDAQHLPPRKAEPIFGFNSRYRRFQNISANTVTADLDALSEQEYKADAFQIDDGWQDRVGDWLTPDPVKFPDGMQPVCAQIRDAGYLPGIWLAPFACEEQSEIVRMHADWLLKDENGDYVRGGSDWGGFYVLDFCLPEVQEHLRQVLDTIVNRWGFGLLKLDFLYAACILPRADKTRGQIMAEAMKFLRENAGDAWIIAGAVPLGAAFGNVDYCRIGCDITLDWDDKLPMRLLHRERASTRHALLNAVFRRQLSGRAFLNDTDAFILSPDSSAMTTPQRQCLAEISALTGGILFTSDNGADYTENQRKMFRRMMRMQQAEVLSAEASDDSLRISFRFGEKEYTMHYAL